jgi:hypothetical protein
LAATTVDCRGPPPGLAGIPHIVVVFSYSCLKAFILSGLMAVLNTSLLHFSTFATWAENSHLHLHEITTDKNAKTDGSWHSPCI